MKIAITSMGDNLNSQVDPRFGRCQFFIIVDPETLEFEAVPNPNVQAPSGAGIATAQMIAQKGVDTVITGNVGPNAYQTLSAAGIKVLTGASGTVRENIERFKQGGFQSATGPSVGAHFGMSGAYPQGGFGMGPGMGRGMGMGRGRGMGMGRQFGMGFPAGPYGPGMMNPMQPSMSKEEELSTLKRQAQAIEQELNEVKRRIDELEKNK